MSEPVDGTERRHRRFGWWGLFAFVALGLALEGLHGFKVAWYLDVTSSTRRHMWTLAHAHGTMLSVINVVWAFTAAGLDAWTSSARTTASTLLVSATILVPAGFFLGGVWIHHGDPGLGIVLVPVGAFALLASLFLTARAAR